MLRIPVKILIISGLCIFRLSPEDDQVSNFIIKDCRYVFAVPLIRYGELQESQLYQLAFCSILLIADDLKNLILSMSNCKLLQSDLDNVFNWCSLNNRPLKHSKYRTTSYTRKSVLFTFTYSSNSYQSALVRSNLEFAYFI